MAEREREGSSLAGQAFRGSAYSVAASMVTLALGFLRAILLARLLLPEHFGVVALALFYIGQAARLRDLGLNMALVHRRDASDSFLSTYFTLNVGLDAAALAILLAATPWLARLYPGMPGLGVVLPALIVVYFVSNLSQVQETLLRRALAFDAVALTDVAASAVMTLVAPYLAWRGLGVWALVAEQASGLGTRFLLTWGPFRRWRPRLGCDAEAARWLWDYGRPTWAASNLGYLLDRFDDFWVGSALGGAALGFYSRAYEYARYPRRVFANPLVSVMGPIFARLQGDRLRLSQAFYRAAHLVLRTGFFIAGLFALAMPEFIHYVIGDKWQPLLWTFRLLLLYAMLDSPLMLVEHLLMAVGRPRAMRRARLLQAAFFLPAVILGARWGGIDGVALAADGMLLLGAAALYRPLREVVDFSLARLAAWPTLALALGWAAGYWLEASAPGAGLAMLAARLGLFSTLFAAALLLAERGDYFRGLRWLRRAMRAREAGA